MTQVAPFRGTFLQVKRKQGATFNLICMASTKELMKTNNLDDATVIDCDDPLAVPTRRSIKKSTSWGINISGTADAMSYATLDTDCDAANPIEYRFVNALPANQGGGFWDGSVWYENLSITSDENGIVKFKATIRGEGPLTYTAGAEPT